MDEPSQTNQAGSALQRAALYGLFTSVAAIGGGIVRAKATAVALGPEGFGTASAILQITGLFFVPLGLVTGPALTSALARARTRGDSGQTYHDTAATLVISAGAVLGLASIGVGSVVFRQQGPLLIAFTALAALAALLDPLARVANASLVARGDVRRYAIVTASTSLIVAAVAAGATTLAGLSGQFVAAATIPLLLLLAFGPLWRRGLPDLRLIPRPAFDRQFLLEAGAVGLANLLTAAASQAALSAIRWALWQEGGAEANGQFQAAWTVAATYLAVVLQGVGTGVFPRCAAASPEALPAEVEAATKFVFDAVPPVILIAIALREPAMHLLYTSEFDVASEIVGYQMAADLAKSLSFVYAGVLLFRGEIRAVIVTEFLGALVFSTASLVLIPRFGPVGAGYGYAISCCFNVLLSSVVLARAARVPLRPAALATALAFTAVTFAVVTATVAWPWLRLPLLVVGVGWATQTGLARTVFDRVRARLASLRG